MVIFIISLECERRDQAWYQALVGHLSEDQKKDLQEVVKLAEQRKEAAGMKLPFGNSCAADSRCNKISNKANA